MTNPLSDLLVADKHLDYAYALISAGGTCEQRLAIDKICAELEELISEIEGESE